MNDLKTRARQSLNAIHAAQLYRHLRTLQSSNGVRLQIADRAYIQFASNDYLGLSHHPKVKAAAIEATRRFGAGSSASRLVSGTLLPHEKLESRLAHFKGSEAALAFSSGYQTAMGVLTSLLSERDVVFSDRLNHACLIDGMRLSRANIKIFEHNDMGHLEKLLRETSRTSIRLIVTESVFSMDGDFAPLQKIVELKQRYDAWIMLDEAHATGLFGERRNGRAAEAGLDDQIDIAMGTLGKALGAAGGFVCGSFELCQFLINRARTFIFSTAPPPAVVAAASEAITIIASPEGKRLTECLRLRIAQLRSRLNLPGPDSSPIIPFHIGSEKRAIEIAAQLAQRHLLVPAIRYPSVPKNHAQLRITLSAQHRPEQIDCLAKALEEIV